MESLPKLTVRTYQGENQMSKEEALAKLKEYPEDLWKDLVERGDNPEEILGWLESFF